MCDVLPSRELCDRAALHCFDVQGFAGFLNVVPILAEHVSTALQHWKLQCTATPMRISCRIRFLLAHCVWHHQCMCHPVAAADPRTGPVRPVYTSTCTFNHVPVAHVHSVLLMSTFNWPPAS